jgi:hypothetical protein
MNINASMCWILSPHGLLGNYSGPKSAWRKWVERSAVRAPTSSNPRLCSAKDARPVMRNLQRDICDDRSNNWGQFFGLDGWVPTWSGIGIGVLIPCISGGTPGKELSFWEMTTSQVPFRLAATIVIMP